MGNSCHNFGVPGLTRTTFNLTNAPTRVDVDWRKRYSYVDDNGDEQIYWYPAEMVEDPDTGAIEYVPTN